MKFKFKILHAALFFGVLLSTSITPIKGETKKTIAACIQEASSKEKLIKLLEEHGYQDVVEALKNVQTLEDAQKALKKLSFKMRLLVQKAALMHRTKLTQLLATVTPADKTAKVAPAA